MEVDQIIPGAYHRRQNCRCDSSGTTPNTNHQTIFLKVEVLQIQFLNRVVDVLVDEHIDDSCDCTSDFQMEVVSKEKCARSLMTVSLKCFQSVRNCEHVLAEAGLAIPSWIEMAATPPSAVTDPEPTGPKFGRQQKASRQLQEKFHLDVVWPSLSDSERAMLRSQHGLLAFAALTALPMIAAQPFRLLLCRLFRLPLHLSSRTC